MAEPHAFFDLKTLLTYQNVMVMLSSWAVIETAKKMFPPFFRSPVGLRILPALPMLVCLAGVWLTSSWQPDATVGERVTLGIVLGAGTANLHAILKRLGVPVDLLSRENDEEMPS